MGVRVAPNLQDSEVWISSLKLRRNQKIMMTGTPEEAVFEHKEDDDSVYLEFVFY
jgi:hypothetical protein